MTMIRVPDNILESFENLLVHESVPVGLRPFYRKWLRYYFDFCHKYQHDISSRESLEPFIEKLSEKNQPSHLKRQASQTISIFYKFCHASQVLRGRQVASLPISRQKSEGTPRLSGLDNPRSSLESVEGTGDSISRVYKHLVAWFPSL